MGEGFSRMGEGFARMGEGFVRMGEGFARMGEGFARMDAALVARPLSATVARPAPRAGGAASPPVASSSPLSQSSQEAPPTPSTRAAHKLALETSARARLVAAFSSAAAAGENIALTMPLDWDSIAASARTRLVLHRLTSDFRREDFWQLEAAPMTGAAAAAAAAAPAMLPAPAPAPLVKAADVLPVPNEEVMVRPHAVLELARGASFFAVLSTNAAVIAEAHALMRLTVKDAGCAVRNLDALPATELRIFIDRELVSGPDGVPILVHVSLEPARPMPMRHFARAAAEWPQMFCSLRAGGAGENDSDNESSVNNSSVEDDCAP